MFIARKLNLNTISAMQWTTNSRDNVYLTRLAHSSLEVIFVGLIRASARALLCSLFVAFILVVSSDLYRLQQSPIILNAKCLRDSSTMNFSCIRKIKINSQNNKSRDK